MVGKVFLLVALCVVSTLAGIPYEGRRRSGSSGGVKLGGPVVLPGGPVSPGGSGLVLPGGVSGMTGGHRVNLPDGRLGPIFPGGGGVLLPEEPAFPGGPGGILPGGGSVMPGGGMIPGGVGQCMTVTPFHTQLANQVISQLGVGYSLRQVTGVRTQIVAGVMYHMDIHVSNNKNYQLCENCSIKIWEQPGGQKITLDSKTCTEVCCY